MTSDGCRKVDLVLMKVRDNSGGNWPERKFVLAEAGNELVPEIHATLFSFYSCYVNRWFLCNFSHHLKKLWTFSLFPFDQKKVVLIIRKLKDHILLIAKFSTEFGVNYQISLHFRSARTSQSNISSLSSVLPSLRAKNLNQCKLVLNHYRPDRHGPDRTRSDQTRLQSRGPYSRTCVLVLIHQMNIFFDIWFGKYLKARFNLRVLNTL